MYFVVWYFAFINGSKPCRRFLRMKRTRSSKTTSKAISTPPTVDATRTPAARMSASEAGDEWEK